MFSELAIKFNTFPEHHQVILAATVAIIVVVGSWSIEKILETYLPQKIYSYVMTLLISLVMLIIIKHFILHVW